jgi:hypothetical protein
MSQENVEAFERGVEVVVSPTLLSACPCGVRQLGAPLST